MPNLRRREIVREEREHLAEQRDIETTSELVPEVPQIELGQPEPGSC